jgi:integrase
VTRRSCSPVRRIEERGAHATAHINWQKHGRGLADAMSAGIAQRTAAQIRRSSPPLSIEATRRSPAGVGMLRRIEAEPAYPPTKLALRLLAISACRPSEVCGAQWQELEHPNGLAPFWRIPPNRMKARVEHIVPLPPQAVAVIETLRPLTGHTKFLFPNKLALDRPMSRHSFRNMFYGCDFRGRIRPRIPRLVLRS